MIAEKDFLDDIITFGQDRNLFQLWYGLIPWDVAKDTILM